MRRKGRGNLNAFCVEVNKAYGRVLRATDPINARDGALDDAIIECAISDQRDFQTTIPFWISEPGSKIKPFLFLGKLTRRRKRRKQNG